jgi:hypothetical protein
MAPAAPSLGVDVAEINPYAPRPYTFTEAAVCLRDAIRAAGYGSELYVNRSNSVRRAIVLGALPPHLPAVDQLDPGRTAVFNFEQLGSDSIVIGEKYVPWLRRWLVADYHSANIDWLREHSPGQRALELPIVPSRSIAYRPDLALEPQADVLFYGTMSPRREALLQRLRDAGLTVDVVAGAYADELAPAIKRARLVLHVHFYEQGLFPVARILQPVMQGVPIVCETSRHSRLNDWSASGVVFADYDALVDACRALARDARERRRRAALNREFAAAIDFKTQFEQLLREMQAAPPPGIAPPQLLRPPPVPGGLSNEEIEAILLEEGATPPEAHEKPAPLQLAERQPGQKGSSAWLLVLIGAVSLLGLWQVMRGFF